MPPVPVDGTPWLWCLRWILMDFHTLLSKEYRIVKDQHGLHPAENRHYSNVLKKQIEMTEEGRGGSSLENKLRNAKDFFNDPLWIETRNALAAGDTKVARKIIRVLQILSTDEEFEELYQGNEQSAEPDLPGSSKDEPKRKRRRVTNAADESIVVVQSIPASHAKDVNFMELRPHQQEGVTAIYRSLATDGGCLLGDEMGAGKTLQTLFVLDTLQRMKAKTDSPSFRVLIVCPKTLIRTWVNEATAWGTEAIVRYNRKQTLNEMFEDARYVVISYKQMSTCHKDNDENRRLTQSIDVVVCDEAHVVKNKKTEFYQSLSSVTTTYKILLTGTPIANGLEDLHTLVSYVAPERLGEPDAFKRMYTETIKCGRRKGATDGEKERAVAAEEQLEAKLKGVLLRRTKTITLKVPKYDFIVMIRMTRKQRDDYNEIARLNANSGDNQSFYFANRMTMVGNHPNLLKKGKAKLTKEDIALSGKMVFADNVIAESIKLGDKVVVVSNWMKTLDILEKLCKLQDYKYIRLDGKCTPKKRAAAVDLFNAPDTSSQVFLLSSKAGGCGIDLYGGNRLIMFDPDYSAASDQQAMARIYRGKQTKPCYIYRPMTACSIDEAKLRIQEHKKMLNNVLPCDDAKQVALFSEEDLSSSVVRPTVVPHLSETHSMMKCGRCCDSLQLELPESNSDGLEAYDHTTAVSRREIDDDLLRGIWDKNVDGITFVFHRMLPGAE